MKAFYDLFPVLLFFIAFKIWGMYVGTAVLMGACAAQTLGYWVVKRKFEKMHVITLVAVVLFGSLTLIIRDKQFIKWAKTASSVIFALVFLASQFIGDKNLVERMMEKVFDMPKKMWARLNVAWALFFLLIGALNILVAYILSDAAWVNFKLFGIMGLTLVFIIGQMLLLKGYIREEVIQEKEAAKNPKEEPAD